MPDAANKDEKDFGFADQSQPFANGFALGSMWESMNNGDRIFQFLHPSVLGDAIKLASFCGYNVTYRETVDKVLNEPAIVFQAVPAENGVLLAPVKTTQLEVIDGGKA